MLQEYKGVGSAAPQEWCLRSVQSLIERGNLQASPRKFTPLAASLAKEHEPFGRFLLSTHIRATRNPKSNASSSVSNVRLRLNRWE
jgi:hypothetical protein